MPSIGMRSKSHEQQQRSENHYEDPEEYAAFHDGLPPLQVVDAGAVAIVRRECGECQRRGEEGILFRFHWSGRGSPPLCVSPPAGERLWFSGQCVNCKRPNEPVPGNHPHPSPLPRRERGFWRGGSRAS